MIIPSYHAFDRCKTSAKVIPPLAVGTLSYIVTPRYAGRHRCGVGMFHESLLGSRRVITLINKTAHIEEWNER